MSTVIQIKKAHATCNTETGEVEIEWPENAPLREAIIGKDIFASGATKNVYKVFLLVLHNFQTVPLLIECSSYQLVLTIT